jgi:MSHA biogenesis protein MshM
MEALSDKLSPARVFGRPDTDDIWIGSSQERALAFLANHGDAATKLLVGPRATGKSTLLKRSLEGRSHTRYFRSTGSWDSPADLLSALLQSADVTPTGSSDTELRNLFTAYLEQQGNQGMHVVLAFDDAQRLGVDVWRELYRLRSLRFEDGSSPELIVVGRPECYGYLQSHSTGWDSVLLNVKSLSTPTSRDIALYIHNRLETAGLPVSLFTPSACRTVAKLSRGSFTSVNLLCQMALLLSRHRETTTVDEYLVRQARLGLAKGATAPKARAGTDRYPEGTGLAGRLLPTT